MLRILRLGSLVSVVSLVILVAVFVASLWFNVSWVNRQARYEWRISKGGLISHFVPPYGDHSGLRIWSPSKPIRWRWVLGARFSSGVTSGVFPWRTWQFPLWFIAVPPAFTLLACRIALRRMRGNICVGCGYSREGVVAARCPECGRPYAVLGKTVEISKSKKVGESASERE